MKNAISSMTDGEVRSRLEAIERYNDYFRRELDEKRLSDIKDDIWAIKEKKLWDQGGYESFEDFCRRCLGVTKQAVYKMLGNDETTRKALEISLGSSTELTSANDQQQPPAQEKQINEPPEKTSKGRKSKPKPEPIDATFTEPAPTQSAELPDKANARSTIAEDAIKAAALETDLVDGEPDAFIAGWVAGYERAMAELGHGTGRIE